MLLAVLVLLVVGAAIAVETAGRGIAERTAEDRIAAQLPAGSGDVDVRITGGAFLPQLVSGTFDRVEVDLPGVQVQGVPVDVEAVLRGVAPLDSSQPVDVQAEARLTGASLAALAAEAGVPGEITVFDGRIGYADSVQVPVIGTEVPFRARLEPRVDGDYVVLRVADAEIGDTGFRIDLQPLLDRVDDIEYPLCAAEQLPPQARVDAIAAEGERVRVDLSADDLPVLDQTALEARGSCGPRG